MKPFHLLTNPGKLRRLHQYATLGLTHYDLNNPNITFHGFETNLLYRVVSDSDEKFILRLAYPDWRRIEDLLSEALWLSALQQDTDIPVPQVIPTKTGELVLSVFIDGIPDVWHMTLMKWLPGRLLGNYLTPKNLKMMGSLFSKLHIHGKNWHPPKEFTHKRFDDWLSRGEENLIRPFHEQSGEGSQTNVESTLPTAQRELLKRMDAHVSAAYQAIDPSDLRVIHCDLWHDNIKLYRGKLYPFDFEDTIWGYRAHDIAMAMLDLLETVGEGYYPSLLAAFRKGYETNLTWPENPIEPFQIGRILWKLNWIAHYQPEYLARSYESHIPVFEIYQRNKTITLPAVNKIK